MKYLVAYILVICCFYLTILPGITVLNDGVSGINCCSECPLNDNTSSKEADDFINEICNPFTHCSCCVGFLTVSNICCGGYIYELTSFIQEDILFKDILFLNSYWQPPKYS